MTSRLTSVMLLTGFLGSGKTSLLQRLLTDPAMARAVVLINEFGEVGLDHELLDKIDDTVVLLKSGCICCTVRGEVADALLNLESLRSRGDIAFDRVVIETTGLADPYPVLQTLTAHPVLRSHFTSGGVLATVDAVNAHMQVSHRAEAVRQIAAADRIVLTKTDLADEETVLSLRQRLARLNPTADLRTTLDAVEDILVGFGPGSLPRRAEDVHVHSSACSHDSAHRHHHYEDAELGVASFSLIVPGTLDWTMFGTWLTLLLHKHGDRIFRVKGILAIEGEDRPVAIHGVQHLVHAPTHMTHWPADMSGPARQSRIVFILEALAPELIRRSFAAFTGLDVVSRAV